MNGQKLRTLVWFLVLVALLVIGCGNARTEKTAAPTATPLARLDGKQVLFVVPDKYSDSEYSITRGILEELGTQVTVASWTPEELLGTSGETLQPEQELCGVRAGSYDAIVFIGGEGVKPTEAEVQRLVQEAVAEGRILAAICASQGILRYAGLIENGVEDPGAVERDGLIITASGPMAAREFGETIAAVLNE